MASTHALWQDYFDDPTLSDLTIRLCDRVVHVHRIVLCRGSEYFAKLLTGNFKESGAKEIELHEDEPIAAVAVLRHIYGLGFDKSHMDVVGERKFLAATFVVAAKYQLNGLEDKTYEAMRKIFTAKKLHTNDLDPIGDFLNAVGTVIAGTTRQDCRMRRLMIDCCFWNLPALDGKVAEFTDLLTDNTDLGAEIITRFRHACSPFEGSWYCGGTWHPNAEPSCYFCKEPFPKLFMLSHRNVTLWECPDCKKQSLPRCWDRTCPGGTVVKWVWGTENQND